MCHDEKFLPLVTKGTSYELTSSSEAAMMIYLDRCCSTSMELQFEPQFPLNNRNPSHQLQGGTTSQWSPEICHLLALLEFKSRNFWSRNLSLVNQSRPWRFGKSGLVLPAFFSCPQSLLMKKTFHCALACYGSNATQEVQFNTLLTKYSSSGYACEKALRFQVWLKWPFDLLCTHTQNHKLLKQKSGSSSF